MNKVFRGSSDFNYAPPLRTRTHRTRWLAFALSFAMVAVLYLGAVKVANYSEEQRAQREAERKLGWVSAERDWYSQGCRVQDFVAGRRDNRTEYREVWRCPDGSVRLGRATDDK